MKLKNIKISNYRCFKKAEIDFADHITLVVGKNGAGKTAPHRISHMEAW